MHHSTESTSVGWRLDDVEAPLTDPRIRAPVEGET